MLANFVVVFEQLAVLNMRPPTRTTIWWHWFNYVMYCKDTEWASALLLRTPE